MQSGFRRPWENDSVKRWVVLTWGGFWVLLVAWMTSTSSLEERLAEEFAFRRVAESIVLQDFARAGYPETLAEWVGFDKEGLRDDSGKLFDTRIESGDFPPSLMPHWATMFLLIDDPDRAEIARKRIDETDSILAKQAEAVDVISGAKDASPDLIRWAERRYLQGLSELPEWSLLEQTQSTPEIETWMAKQGNHILLRGMKAHAFTAVVIGVGVIGTLFFWVRRKEMRFVGASFRLEESGWKIRHLLREFLIAEILGIVGAVLTAQLLSFFGLHEVVMFVSGAIFVLVPPIWLSLRLTPGFVATAKLFRIRDSGWRWSQLAIFTGFGMAIFLFGVGAILLLDRSGSSLADSLVADQMDSMSNVLWSYFFAVVLAPISEEVVFRGFLFGGTRHHWGVIPAALISSGIFAVLHGYSMLGLLAVFGYGLIFCWIYQRSGSLLPGMLVHAVFNYIATSETLGWFSFH